MEGGEEDPPIKQLPTDEAGPKAGQSGRAPKTLSLGATISRSGRDSLQIQRIDQKPAPAASDNITRLRLDAPERQDRAPRVFETVRIIDLARFRQSLRRQRSAMEAKGGDFAVASAVRSRLLVLLDELYTGAATRWPDVVVVRRPDTGVIETNYALIGDTIFLGAHLSDDWSEGKESDRFYATLFDALTVLTKSRRSQFEQLPAVRRTDSEQPD